MCSLPPIPCNATKLQREGAQKEFKCPSLKLPSWDLPAIINWEPLEPPSPYVHVMPKRAYPFVTTGLSRLVESRADRRVKSFVSTNKKGMTNTSSERTCEEDNVACLLFLIKEESVERDTIVFREQRESTHLWVEFLRHLSVFLDANIQMMEENSRSAHEREESRRRMCYAIEMESGAWFIQKRFQNLIQKKMAELMTVYREGRNCIMNEETEQLAAVLDWFKKKRPFGMRLPKFLDEGRKSLYPKKPTGQPKASCGTYRRKSSMFKTKVPIQHSPKDSWPDVFPEVLYQEEGRRAWKEDKNMRYTQRKSTLGVNEVEELQETACADIFAEESAAWLHILELSVDDHCNAKRREQERENAEIMARLENLDELQKREVIFTRLSNEAANKRETAAVEDQHQRELSHIKLENEMAIEKEMEAIENLKRREADFWSSEDMLAIQKEIESLEDLKRREADFWSSEDMVAIQKEMESLESLKRFELYLIKLENEMAIQRETEAIENLKRREHDFWSSEDMVAIQKEMETLEDLKRTESYLIKLENEMVIREEMETLEDLKRAESYLIKLENEMSIRKEVETLEDLKQRVLMTEERKICESNVDSKGELGALRVSNVSCVEAAGQEGNIEPCQNNGREEGSSSCDSDLHGAPLHPMLNMVLSIALERDPYLALRNPALSALGDAERVLAACEGRSAGSATRAFALACHVPFCPAYLVHALWCPPPSRDEVNPSNLAGITDEHAAHVEQIMELETEERVGIIKEQLIVVWELYQQAAAEASEVSKTKYGELFYVGVSMPSEF